MFEVYTNPIFRTDRSMQKFRSDCRESKCFKLYMTLTIILAFQGRIGV